MSEEKVTKRPEPSDEGQNIYGECGSTPIWFVVGLVFAFGALLYYFVSLFIR